jgi:hypothetical protein
MPDLAAAERIAAGELLMTRLGPRVRHLPRHPSQREGTLTSLCNQTVEFILPDAPAVRERTLDLCPRCHRKT